MESIQITSNEATRLHGERQCIHTRKDNAGVSYAHCMKFSTNPKNRYKNTINNGIAKITINTRTPKENKLVLSGTPVHILTYGGGTQTMYHGRYKCSEPSNKNHFIMEYFDKGVSEELVKETETMRKSKLEKDAETFFDLRGWHSIYEPCIFPYGKKHYTPDYYLPEQACFVEIKGFRSPDGKQSEPTKKTLDKCQAVSAKGFSIVLVQGSVLDSPVFTYWEPYGLAQVKKPWWWSKRKRN